MRIDKKIFFFFPFLIASVGMGYYLTNSISSKHNEAEKIKHVDEQVINKLQAIREVQIAYMEGTHEYASEWDTLIAFAKTGELYVTQRKEEVISRPFGDSIVVTIDTIGVNKAFDVIHEKTGLTMAGLEQLSIVPVSKDTFSLYANRLQGTWVTEIKDEKPLNPRRQEGGDWKPLKIGSKLQATTKGNWE